MIAWYDCKKLKLGITCFKSSKLMGWAIMVVLAVALLFTWSAKSFKEIQLVVNLTSCLLTKILGICSLKSCLSLITTLKMPSLLVKLRLTSLNANELIALRSNQLVYEVSLYKKLLVLITPRWVIILRVWLFSS